MDLPQIQRYGDVWTLYWQAFGVAMGFDKVREARDDITAQVTVECDHPPRKGRILGPIRLNLLSMQSQNSFAKALDAQLADIPWNHMVVPSCAIVVKQFTAPSPAINLADVDASGFEDRYLFPMLPVGETTFCYGDSESLKSTLVQAIGCCIQQGAPLPWGPRPLEQLQVLYCDWETNEVVLASRVRRLALGMGLEARVNMTYRGTLRTRNATPLRTLADEAGNLREQIQREGIGLVIVDSIGFAVDGKLVDDDVARGAMAALRQLPCTRLVVAHISKESSRQGGGRVDPFGSTFFRAGIRSGFEVRRSEEDTFEGADIGIYHWKSNDGAHVKPFGLRVSFEPNDGPIHIERQDLAEVPDLAMRTSLATRLRQLLAHGGARTIIDLADQLDAKPDTVKHALQRMPDALRIDDGGRGAVATWGLRA